MNNAELADLIKSDGLAHISRWVAKGNAEIESQIVAALRAQGELAAALRELVALKDLKDECSRVRQRRPHSVTREFPKSLLDDEADYKRRKPIAWDAARAALAKVKESAK